MDGQRMSWHADVQVNGRAGRGRDVLVVVGVVAALVLVVCLWQVMSWQVDRNIFMPETQVVPWPWVAGAAVSALVAAGAWAGVYVLGD